MRRRPCWAALPALRAAAGEPPPRRLAVLVVLTMASLASAQIHTPPEIIFINGDIYPGAVSTLTRGGSPGFSSALPEPRAQAMADLLEYIGSTPR